MFLHGHILLFVLGIGRSRVTGPYGNYLIFWGTAKLFSKVVESIYSPISNEWVPISPHPHQHLVLSVFFILAILLGWNGLSLWSFLSCWLAPFPWLQKTLSGFSIIFIWLLATSLFISCLEYEIAAYDELLCEDKGATSLPSAWLSCCFSSNIWK